MKRNFISRQCASRLQEMRLLAGDLLRSAPPHIKCTVDLTAFSHVGRKGISVRPVLSRRICEPCPLNGLLNSSVERGYSHSERLRVFDGSLSLLRQCFASSVVTALLLERRVRFTPSEIMRYSGLAGRELRFERERKALADSGKPSNSGSQPNTTRS